MINRIIIEYIVSYRLCFQRKRAS